MDANRFKWAETSSKAVETGSNWLKLKKGVKMRVWNIQDNFGQSGQVRLRRDGRLEIRNNGQRIWRLIKYINIGLFTDRDIEESLKQTGGISKVTRG